MPEHLISSRILYSTVMAFGPCAMLLPALRVYESSPSSGHVKVDAKTGEDPSCVLRKKNTLVCAGMWLQS